MSGFNPRLPGGRRLTDSEIRRVQDLFQSTPSGGKATIEWINSLIAVWFQSTPSGGKATDGGIEPPEHGDVSIHAFRGEGDRDVKEIAQPQDGFNPRLPGGRRLSMQTRHL